MVVVLAVLLVTTAVTPATLAQQADQPVRDAELTVRQESYVEEGVARKAANGTPVYEVRGERVWLRPSNFDAGSVVQFGVEREGADLTFDQSFGAYSFTSNGAEASFRVFWVVIEPVSTTNATNGTVAATRRVRYEATIKVVGQADLDHLAAGQIGEIRADAATWSEVDDRLEDLQREDLLVWQLLRGGDPPSKEVILQGAFAAYVTTRDPFRLLTGGLRNVIIVLVLSIGGLAYLAMREGYGAFAFWRMKRALNIHKSNEAAEGELAERVLEFERSEKHKALQNVDWQDLGFNDDEAAAYRQLGDTTRQGFENLLAELPPAVWFRDRLRAMHHCGYRALVEREDGGDVLEAELVELDAPDAPDEPFLTDLEDVDDELLAALTDDPLAWSFDPVTADYDPVDVFDVDPPTLSLDGFADELERQLEWFDDPEQLAQGLHEHVRAVAASNYTDSEGRPRVDRRALNSWLRASQLIGETMNVPSARVAAQHLERILIDHDPTREAEQLAQEIEGGQYA